MADERHMTSARLPTSGRRINWNDPSFRAILYQIIVMAVVLLTAWYLFGNLQANLRARNIATGFHFLELEAGFGIGESLIDYAPSDSYAKAIWVGILNTLRVAFLAIVLSTVLGTLVGIARLSQNWLAKKICSAYVEGARNVPLLLQLFFWYALITEALPAARNALNPLPGVYISQRGIVFPVTAFEGRGYLILGALLIGCIIAVILSRWARRRQDRTGAQFRTGLASTGVILVSGFVGWLISGAPTAISVPELRGFNFAGGGTFSPEFAALLIGLVVYSSAFVAEIVRSGIQAVSHGQTEAASALGLTRAKTLRLVILPQAMRVIVPPMTNQYLNITKNSSLAVAIGYPDLVNVGNTTLNQTGQAIEGIAIIMAIYLTISLSISLFMNWYNKHIALVER